MDRLYRMRLRYVAKVWGKAENPELRRFDMVQSTVTMEVISSDVMAELKSWFTKDTDKFFESAYINSNSPEGTDLLDNQEIMMKNIQDSILENTTFGANEIDTIENLPEEIIFDNIREVDVG